MEVRATDPGGRSAAESFVVTVRNNRAAQVVQGLPDLELVAQQHAGVNVSRVFVDPDGLEGQLAKGLLGRRRAVRLSCRTVRFPVLIRPQ